MSKLYFKYGVMGSSKTAQSLITEFNYKENDNNVIFIKPATDNRDGENIIRSRIGLQGEALVVKSSDKISPMITDSCDVIISDESQFFTPSQIEELKDIAVERGIPVICYGLLTDFQTKLFPGSKRLIELADSLQEIKMVCKCGRKATVNARFVNGKVVTEGEQVMLGGNESYKAMCYKCWKNAMKK